jgi:putative colanic acid biosysnthesis UDP-glucose lipid carrier transferase
VKAATKTNVLVIRSGFIYLIQTGIPFFAAIFSTWRAGWFDPSVVSLWPGMVAVLAGGFLVRFDVSALQRAMSYKFLVINTLAVRSAMAGFIGFVALMLDGVRGKFLETALTYALLMFVITTVATVVVIAVSLLRRFRRTPMKLTIVAVTESSVAFVRQLQSHPYLALEFVGFFEDREAHRLPDHSPYKVLCGLPQAKDYLNEHPVHHVLISFPLQAGVRFDKVLEQLLDTTCSVHYLHDFLLFKPIREGLTSMGKLSVFTIIDAPSSGWGPVFKRCFDIAASLAALLVLSPLLALVALWIKLDSKGPVLFVQNRWGDGGDSFKIYKFRSMTQAASGSAAAGDTNIVQATKGDARVTKVGAFIRRTSIDELPQLLNILRGDMSIVGPRPHAISHNEAYRKLVKGYMLRHKMKPGLTGWAQIHGFRGETDTLDKMQNRVEFDLEYLRTWTPVLDIYIIYKTLGLVLRRTNAY